MIKSLKKLNDIPKPVRMNEKKKLYDVKNHWPFFKKKWGKSL